MTKAYGDRLIVSGLNILMVFLLSGCTEEVDTENVVAKVYERVLTKEELGRRLPPTLTAEDSVKRAKVIINTWVRKQVILERAKFNLDEEARFQEMLEDYLDDLYIHEYESLLVQQEMDTSITEEQKQIFYEENLDEFQLKKWVLRGRLLVFDAEEEIKKELKKAFKSFGEEDSLFLATYAEQNALRYLGDEQRWLYVEDLLSDFPMESAEFRQKAERKEYLDIELDGRIHLLHIAEIRLEDDVTPFDLVEDRIRSTILNQRKLELLGEMRESLFQEALEQGNIYILDR